MLGKRFMDSWKLQRNYGKSWKISKVKSKSWFLIVKMMSKSCQMDGEMVSWYILMPLSKSWIHMNPSWSWSQIRRFQELLCSHSIKAVPSKVEQWGHKWSQDCWDMSKWFNIITALSCNFSISNRTSVNVVWMIRVSIGVIYLYIKVKN